MGKRLSVDEKVAAIRRLRATTDSSEKTTELRRGLGDRSNLVVAAAAAIAGDTAQIEMAGDLEAAFDRFLVDPLKDDKLCRAKLAIIQALDKLEHDRGEVFQKAAGHVQLEPVWGGKEDSAATLRAAAVFALARIGGPNALKNLADGLADPEREVRVAAAQALGQFGAEAAGLLLRLKARIGDSEADVLSECLSGLLTIDPKDNLDFVCEYLDPGDQARCEAAVLALGKSRLPEALGALQACYQRAPFAGLRDQLLLAIAMLRVPAAIDSLLELVASDSEAAAVMAISALKMHNYDPRLCERLAYIVRERGSRTLQARFERDFRTATEARGSADPTDDH
jgi:HEAT repeat protein